MKVLRWISIGLIAALPAGASLSHDVVLCQLPEESAPSAVADGLRPADYGAGARLVRLRPDGSQEQLSSGFASACDPDVSFDGERMLFAAQREAGDPWTLWESRIDGSQPRQITHGALDARQPIYLSTFYTITSSEPWYTILFVGHDGSWNEAGTALSTSLYTVRLDGSELRRITFNPSAESTPFLMPDGLLVFAGWKGRASAHGPEGRLALYGVQPDGIDYALYGASQGARLQHMPAVVGGKVFFVEAERWPWDGAGRLATVARRRPHHSYRPFDAGEPGLFHSPSPLADGALLVSRRPEDGSGTLDLFRLDPETGRLDALLVTPDAHEMHARAIAPRAEPDGRSSTVRTEFETGKLYGLDIYESQGALAGVPRGAIRELRVIEALPQPESAPPGARALQRRILGVTAVEEDGSFHLDIPADLAVQLQALDEQGLARATCDWIWVKQREFRGCIGCHEDPELTPENRLVQAAKRPAEQLMAPPAERRSMSFRSEIAPLLRERCVTCHGSPESLPEMGSLVDESSQRGAYDTLLSGHVWPGEARSSHLVLRILGATDDEHGELLTPEERRLLVEWVDLGAPWDRPPPPPAATEGATP